MTRKSKLPEPQKGSIPYGGGSIPKLFPLLPQPGALAGAPRALKVAVEKYSFPDSESLRSALENLSVRYLNERDWRGRATTATVGRELKAALTDIERFRKKFASIAPAVLVEIGHSYRSHELDNMRESLSTLESATREAIKRFEWKAQRGEELGTKADLPSVGRRQNSHIEVGVRALLQMWLAHIPDERVNKTLADPNDQFVERGLEFVDLMLRAIDPSVEHRSVKTALKKLRTDAFGPRNADG